MHYSCLIVDDEEPICQTTCDYFNLFDLPSAYVTSYDGVWDFLENNTISLLILDVNLGKHSGFELCKKLRECLEIPILFISARDSETDILTALNIGGDDYVTKPFSLSILLAKAKIMLKRFDAAAKTSPEKEISDPENLTENESRTIRLDYNYHQLLINDSPVHLKEMEFKVLSYLMEHAGTVISKDEFFTEVWKDSFISEGTLSVHIRRLRQKIEEDPDHPVHLKTVWGVGYVWEDHVFFLGKNSLK